MNIINQKTVNIRKPRNCYGCTINYPIGTEMLVTTSVDCGEISSSYWCKECMSINLTDEYRDNEGYMYGEFRQRYEEQLRDQAK